MATYTTATLLGLLPQTYFGNPNSSFSGQDYIEPFAFINFYGVNGTTWTKIVFSESTDSGFEADNFTSRVLPFWADPNDSGNLPGVPVEEIQIVNGVQTTITDTNLINLRSTSTLTVSSAVTTYGNAVTLSGSLNDNSVYPANGETIGIIVNGVTYTATVTDNTGDFSATIPAGAIPASNSPYTVTYTYAGDSNLRAVSNTATTLTVNPPAVPDISVCRTAQTRLYLALSLLQNNLPTVAGDPVTITGYNLTTAEGITMLKNSSFLLYSATNIFEQDHFTYTTSDKFGATNTGTVYIDVCPFATGQKTGTITPTNGVVHCQFFGIQGYTYVVERSTDLNTWAPISTQTVGASGVINVVDGSPPSPAYYRLKWQP